jgi:hypothetical protein
VRSLFALPLLACGPSVVVPNPDDSASPETDPEPYIEIDTPDEPSWTAEELESILITAFETGIPDVLTLREHYRDFMLQAEEDCPLYEDSEHENWVGVWASECTTTSGIEFFGTALYQEYHSDKPGEGEEMRLDLGMVASYELTDTDGSTFVGGGGFILTRGPIEYGISWSAQIGGSYRYPAAGGWLGEGIEAGLFLDGVHGEARSLLTIDGGVGWSGVDIHFHEVLFDSYSCELYPEGTISVRDALGYWYDMSFDCGACAELVWRDQSLGEVCPGDALAAAVLTDVERMGGLEVEE